MSVPILLVAFGAASPAAKEIYALMEADVRAAYPDHPVRWAWTAKTLVARLRERGETVFTLGEALDSLRGEGHRFAALLSLHLVPGEKHQEILREDHRGLCLAYGEPLLTNAADVEAVAKELLGDLPADRPVLVVAHGHAHEIRFNAELKRLGERLRELRRDVHLTRLEGEDDPGGLENFMTVARTLGRVHVAPFLFVAGDHVQNDILGDDPESLKSRLGVQDFTCGEVLCLRPWVRRRFLQRLATAITTLEEA